MKKGIFSMAVLAAMCVGGYFGHSAYQESKLTDLELANVEALSDVEGWIELDYADACLSGYDDICVMSPTKFFYESKKYTKP